MRQVAHFAADGVAIFHSVDESFDVIEFMPDMNDPETCWEQMLRREGNILLELWRSYGNPWRVSVYKWRAFKGCRAGWPEFVSTRNVAHSTLMQLTNDTPIQEVYRVGLSLFRLLMEAYRADLNLAQCLEQVRGSIAPGWRGDGLVVS